MDTGFVVIGLSVVLCITAMVVVLVALKRRDAQELHPQGYYLGLGMGFGMLLGALAQFVMRIYSEDDVMPTLGPSMGLALGVAVGVSLEQKYADRLRPPTEAEQKRKRVAFLVAIGLAVLGIAVFLVLVLRS